MLDQLVESRNNSAENTRRSGFLLATMVVIVTVLTTGWAYSLFHKEYGMGTGDLDVSSLVAPVALPEDAPPPPPPPEDKPDKPSPASDKPTVIDKIARIEDTTDPPKDIKGETLKAPPLSKSDAKNYDLGTKNEGRYDSSKQYNDIPKGLGDTGGGGGNGDEDDKVVVKTPTPKPTEKPTEKPIPKTISGGVVNGKATNLVKPPYPAAAKAVRAAGAVNVQVTIDETGNVISASAVSGHPLLRAAAVQAARSSKFSPTMLSGQAVKVTGVIVYNFVP